MLFDYESVRRVLHDPITFSSAMTPPSSATGRWLIFSDPPRHAKLRALIARAFTPRSVADLEPRVRELCRRLVAPLALRGEAELVGELAVPLPLMVIAEMLGAPPADWPRFRRWSDALLGLAHVVSGDAGADQAVTDFVAVHGEMGGYLSALLASRRATPREDLLSRLLHAEVDGERLSEEEILAFFQLLLLAGHETTTNLIANAVLCLDEHREQLALLQSHPNLVPSAVEEVLRYRSPVQTVFRRTTAAVELHGRTIPPGALVLAMIGSANRDPRQFRHPDRFDVMRQPNPHIAFGHGIHFCVGSALSRLEARVALPMLLEALPELTLADSVPWEPRPAFHVHGPARLRIRFAPRVAAPSAAASM
jgi:cytochrome P450